MTDTIWHEIGINPQHVCESSVGATGGGDTDVDGRYQLICDKAWLQALERHRKLTPFTPWPQLDRRAHPTGQLEHPWTRILVQTYRKQPQRNVYALPRYSGANDASDAPSTEHEQLPMTYSQAVAHVASGNFKQLWEQAHKRYTGAHVKLCRPQATPAAAINKPPSGQGLVPHDTMLRELIQRVHNCPVLHCSKQDGGGNSHWEPSRSDCHSNVLPALVAIETSTHFCVLYYPAALDCSLYDCLSYSPAVLGRGYNKTLFLIYQLLQLAKHLQADGLFLGDLRLQNIMLRENLWLQVLPRLQYNLISDNNIAEVQLSPLSPTSVSEELQSSTSTTMFDLKLAFDPGQFTLREYSEMWCNGQLSNFDYLTILNNACGRSVRDPAHHHIMPWVSDLAARNGANWRDLTKSKYRLNKGDVHLDLMYESALAEGAPQVAHHVSDFLSEITYFVYTARRTPQNTLCAHVRPIWVPAEYPVSIQRLQEWTPDECIPEFYSDPMIFKSIHEDLPDLELPAWATCPEDFIAKHREALESQHVSERLHHWIDLNFGYKLSGKAAVKSKNVCLSMVDQHRTLCQRGIVQLFTQPHPPRRNSTPWFNSNAPRLSQLYGGGTTAKSSPKGPPRLRVTSESRRLAKSTENLSAGNYDESSNSNSQFYPMMTNFIELPEHYNPAVLLQNLEALETFYARTFPQQQAAANPEQKIMSSDLLFEQNAADHSFTNEVFVAALPPPGVGASTKPTCRPRNLQQLLPEQRERDLQAIGCLIVELFALQRLRPLLTGNGLNATFEARLKSCRTVATLHRQELPKCVRRVVQLLLHTSEEEVDLGLPQPVTAAQLLEPMFANMLLPFPTHYYAIYRLVGALHSFDFVATLLELYTHFNCDGRECGRYTEIDRHRVLFERKIAECKVMACCAHLRRLLEPLGYEQFSPVELLLPHIIDLLTDERTSILTAWNLFDPVAQALGVAQTQQHLLQPIMKLYDVECFERSASGSQDGQSGDGGNGGHLRYSTSSSFKSRKSVKLYHHSFLLRLIVRFGLRCFLEHFIAPLVEAVGGYKEPEQGNGFHYHSGSSRRTSKHLSAAAVVVTEPELPLPDLEEVFSFEGDDGATDADADRISSENKSIDSFDAANPTATTTTVPATAEEAFEFEEQPPIGPRSPTIDIPASAFRRSFQLSAIDCDIGSRKSVDSFELIAQATPSAPTASTSDTEACDSLQASVISKLSEAKAMQNNRISEMSAESLVWLSHRLGPVLTSRHITRNLLKMLSLCYVGQENLLPECEDAADEESNNINYFSMANARVVGDRSAARVLECLMSIAALFGEPFLMLQYFPHIGELVALCAKRMTGSLEGAVISALQLFKCMVPCLTDKTILEHLQDVLLDTVLLPVLRLLGSTQMVMPSGYLGRSLLARKLLDAIYALSVRLGMDISKDHLCQPLLGPFFAIFSTAYALSSAGAGAGDEDVSVGNQRAQEELRDVFGPELAHTGYLMFLRFLGETIMHRSLDNLDLVLTLCHEYEQPSAPAALPTDDATKNDDNDGDEDEDEVDASDLANSFGNPLVGNRLSVGSSRSGQTAAAAAPGPVEVLDMVAYKLDQLPSGRHLKGNWLAYWRHEITRSDKDTQPLNLKQIRLQSFVGHTNSVRAIHALDNENSFISASKDKTVKLWSLRSEGDGKRATACQFTYTAHKKSIHSLCFLTSMRYVVSCDSGVHLWDPFIGRPLGILDAPRHCAVTVVKCLPSHSPLIVAGTAESAVKIIDARTMRYVNEWRVCNATLPNATVRCVAVAPSGHWLAVGLSSGGIVLLDTRTGMLLNSWRPTECDVLQLSAPNDQQLVSSALDHSLAVWHAHDGILHYQLKPPPEPAHFLQSVGSSLVYATTGNRVGVYADVANSHSVNTVTKLRSETFRGMLTSLAVLPLNRALLAGNESGNIALLC